LKGPFTPVTPESFAAWQKNRKEKKAAESELLQKAKATQRAAGRVNGMSGRHMFEFGGVEEDEAVSYRDGSITEPNLILTAYLRRAKMRIGISSDTCQREIRTPGQTLKRETRKVTGNSLMLVKRTRRMRMRMTAPMVLVWRLKRVTKQGQARRKSRMRWISWSKCGSLPDLFTLAT
jgi:hypothetical protein